MEFLQVLLAVFGGSAAALAVVGVLAKLLISQRLAQDLERLRSRLKVESDSLVESTKSKLKVEGDLLVESTKAELASRARLEDRKFEMEQIMRRYKGPLLHAVYDLQSRLYNILANRFFENYLTGGSPEQKHYVEHNTAFLIAQFFGWTEIIRQEVQFIEFAESEKTHQLSDIRDEIYSLWQTDRFNDPLMIWAGEQRGIGELMIERQGEKLTCKGYASFLRSFGAAQEQLMDRLTNAVLASAADQTTSHDRLRAVQNKLIDMLDVLDPENVRFRKDWRAKA